MTCDRCLQVGTPCAQKPPDGVPGKTPGIVVDHLPLTVFRRSALASGLLSVEQILEAEGAVRAINMGFKLVTLSNEVGLMTTYAKMQVNATRKDSGGKA